MKYCKHETATSPIHELAFEKFAQLGAFHHDGTAPCLAIAIRLSVAKRADGMPSVVWTLVTHLREPKLRSDFLLPAEPISDFEVHFMAADKAPSCTTMYLVGSIELPTLGSAEAAAVMSLAVAAIDIEHDVKSLSENHLEEEVLGELPRATSILCKILGESRGST